MLPSDKQNYKKQRNLVTELNKQYWANWEWGKHSYNSYFESVTESIDLFNWALEL